MQDKLKLERDEADRRAGAAEREMASLKDDLYRLNNWRERQKEAAGYHRNTSFDIVWAETLSKAKDSDALKDDMAFIKRWVQRVHDKETTLEEFYGVLRYYTPLKPVEAALARVEGV